MARRITWSFPTAEPGWTTAISGFETLPGVLGVGDPTVTTQLYISGVEKLPIAYLSGHNVQTNPQHASNAGDSNNDTLWMRSGTDANAILWDDLTTNSNNPTNGPPYTALYGASRYGLPGGQVGQENISFEFIRGGDDFGNAGSGDDVISHDFINLSYSAASGGVAYNLNITIDVGPGRDLVIGGEGNDVIYGGDENLNLGDGLFGMGGNDTLYGGFNVSSTGADDLFGYAGNDTLYGFNNGDVFYGDQGNDVIFMPRSALGTSDVGGFANPATAALVFNFQTATAFGGDGDDTIFASAVAGVPDGPGFEFLNREYFVGGNVPAQWSDASYFLTPNGQDNGQDTVSYAFANSAIVVNLNMTQPDPGDFLGAWGTGSGGATNDRFYGIEHLVGSSFADTIYGSAVGNNLFGGAGNVADTLFGAAGSDMLIGGDGDDRIDAGADNDLVEGGAGADSLIGGTGSDTLSYSSSSAAVNVTLGGAGTGGDAQGDTVANDFENLLGSAFNDTLIGDAGINAIFGQAGDDFIQGGAGGDSLVGGDGKDTLSYSNSAAGVNVTLGGSTGTGGDAAGDNVAGDFEVLLGSAQNDTLGGSNIVNTILGGNGNDTIEGGAGGDSLDGGAGSNALSYSRSSAGVNVTLAGSLLANGDAQGDTIANFVNLIGSDHNDGLTGDSLGSNTIFGGAGNDAVDGLLGNDTLYGGSGIDFAIYGNSPSSVVVNLALNTATGGLDNDRLFEIENVSGSNFNDTITGDGLANTLLGQSGVDTIEGGLGDDVMAGVDFAHPDAPSDGDWLSYNGAAAAGVQVSLFAGTSVGSAGNDTFGGFRNLLGSNAGGDFLEGDDENNIIIGQGGNDTLSGLASIDSVYGGEGDDTIIAGTNGGTFDTTVVGGWDGDSTTPIEVTLPLGTERVSDLMFGGNGIDTVDMRLLIGDAPRTFLTMPDSTISNYMAGIEIIIAGAAANVINLTFNDGVTQTAYAESVTIFAGENSDIVFSGSGSDLIVGGRPVGPVIEGEAGDTLFGGQGSDTIFGDDIDSRLFGGDDSLYGGIGNDTIDGGVGNDTIFGGEGKDLLRGWTGDDLIADTDDAVLLGEAGNDILLIDLHDAGSSESELYGGSEDDRAYVTGFYAKVNAEMGTGDDVFISYAIGDDGSGDLNSGRSDRVLGEDGDDLVSTWYGDDTIDGGAGGDVIWGGAGVDTIMGGADSDYLYGGFGDGDLLIGGDGGDFYYWARNDGDDRIEDQDPGGVAQDNYILVFAGFETNPANDLNGDAFIDGAGVFEADGNLYDNDGDDMVQITVDPNDNSRLILTVLQGEGAGSTLNFDPDEITMIGLANSDTGQVTAYAWNDTFNEYRLI